MSRFLMTVPLVIILSVVLAAPVQAAGLNEVIAAVQEPFRAETANDRRIRDYRADFLQEAQIVSLDRVQKAVGRVVVRFEKLNDAASPKVSFRWEYTQPSVQQIVSDGDSIWVYLPENNQVLLSEASQLSTTRENDPMTFLTGLGNLTRDFQIAWAEPERSAQGDYRIDLQPRRTSALVARLVMVVDRAAVDGFLRHAASGARELVRFPVVSTTVIDTNGNRSMFTFENTEVNTGTTADSFTFTVPEGVEVVRPAEGGFGF
jgi:outer membrane lipoprotein carrier protein